MQWTDIHHNPALQDLHTLSFKKIAFFLDEITGMKYYGEEKVHIETKDLKKTERENLEILKISGPVSPFLKNWFLP